MFVLGLGVAPAMNVRTRSFHALWMPYKEFVFPTLPKKKNSPLLTEEGEDWGKCAWLHTSVNSLVMHVNSHNRLWSTHTVWSQPLGNFLYSLFYNTFSEHAFKSEFDRANEILNDILALPATTEVLGKACVEAVKELQLKLQAKERKLARYLKRGITNSNRSETTSPVESLNNSFKHGDRGVNSNFRLSRTLDTILDHTDGRIEEENRRCQRAMGNGHEQLCVTGFNKEVNFNKISGTDRPKLRWQAWNEG